MIHSSSRPGATLIELLIFMALLAGLSMLLLPLLYNTNQNRVLQQTMALVEQNGSDIVQTMTLRIREGERIMYPAMGETGALLHIQTGSGGTDPTIIGVSTGAIYVVRRASKEQISSSQVAVTNFVVRNVSTSVTRPSVVLSFTVSKTLKLQQPYLYGRSFEMAVSLPQDDHAGAPNCACIGAYCAGSDIYRWYVCQSDGMCADASTMLECP